MLRSLATSSLALVVGAGAAFADLTPADVWTNIERSMTDSGSRIEVGAREETSDRLVLNDVVVSSPGEDEDISFSLTFPRMIFEDAGSGQVRSVIEGDMQFVARGTDYMGEETGFDMVARAPGNETISSGTADDMRHVYTIPEMTLTGSGLGAEDAALTVTLSDLRGDQTIRLVDGGGNEQTYDLGAAAMRVTISGTEAAGEDGEAAPGRFEGVFSIEDLAMTGEGTSPAGVAGFDADPSEALRAGLSGTAKIVLGQMTGQFEAVSTDHMGEVQEASGTVAAAGSEIDIALSGDGLTLGGVSTGMAVDFVDPSTGMPVAYQIAEASSRLVMPLLARDEEQPFALSYMLGGLTLDESLWSTFDPESQLPRDPATIAIDLEGQVLVTTDLMDPATAESPDMPFAPRSLTVNRIALDAVGASAEMAGALTFGDDPTQPEGSLTGDFRGVNGLLDRLVAMGFIPAEQLMGTRMMMAMFARPVDGDQDHLRSEIEFREDGSIYANGQQVK